ncbi:MAG: hypothetical protein EOP83_05155 [Verrucomicrobiaceae bacterium]|nr:MAG: hypothetical protein EOP83_05155 [Verrucomicrobiaceae bacterium]
MSQLDPLSYEALQEQFSRLIDNGRCLISPDGNHILVKLKDTWDVIVFLKYDGEAYGRSLNYIAWAGQHGLRLKPAMNEDQPGVLLVHEKGTGTLVEGLDDDLVVEYKMRWF